MGTKKTIIIFCIFMLVSINFVQAQTSIYDLNGSDTSITQRRLEFGHVAKILSVNMDPSVISPGKEGVLSLEIFNSAKFKLYDSRITLQLPNKISLLDDVNKRKIAYLNPGEKTTIKFRVVTSPDITEGVYNAYVNLEYLNHLGIEREENDTIGIIVGSIPNLFVTLDSTELTTEKNIGKITLKFVNNDVANIKFLTATLKKSKDYEILSNNKEYIGNLDSDDFESTDFKIKLLSNKRSVPILLEISYKDSLNNDYSENLEVNLNLQNPEELGTKKDYTKTIIISILIFLVIAYFFYKKFKKK